MHLRFVVFLCIAVTIIAAARKLPSYIKICKRSDPELSSCIKESYKIVFQHGELGIPEMNIRPFNPVIIDKLSIANSNGQAVNLDAQLNDVKLHGIQNSELVSVKVDFEKGTFKGEIFTPAVFLEAKFGANGKVLLFQFDSNGVFRANLTDFVKICKRYDPNILKCLQESFVDVISRMGNGIPEMGLRPLDPATVDQLHLVFGNNNAINMDINMIKPKVYGCMATTLKDGLFDIDNGKYEMEFFVPEIYMVSDFKGNGNVLMIKINSNGAIRVNTTNCVVTAKWDGKYYEKEGEEHMKLDNFTMDVFIDKIYVEVDGLFGDNKDLQQATNRLINENLDLLYDEMKPVVLHFVKTFSFEANTNVFDAFPMRVLFPK